MTPWKPDARALAKVAEQYVRDTYPPPGRLRNRPLAILHGERLAKLSSLFTSDRDQLKSGYLQDARTRSAYLLYYLSTSAATAMAAARLSGVLDRVKTPTLRVLDVGAGPLSASIGLALLAPDRGFEITALDTSSAALRDGAAILGQLRPDVSVVTQAVDLRDHRSRDRFGTGYDVVLVGNFLNELKRTKDREFPQALKLVDDLLARLSPGGVLLMFEPGTRSAFDRVLAVREAFVTGGLAQVVAPCLGSMACPLHGQRKRDWCHAEQHWTPPKLIDTLDEAIGHQRTVLKFSYLALANFEGGRPNSDRPEGDRTDAHRTDREALQPTRKNTGDPALWRVIGGHMHQRGILRRYLCGPDGRAVARTSLENLPPSHPLRAASRGDLIPLTGKLSIVRRGKAEEVTLDIAAQRHEARVSRQQAPDPRPPSRGKPNGRGGRR